MNRLKKIAAAALAAVVLAGTTACSGDVSWAAKKGDVTVAPGVYIFSIFNAYSSAGYQDGIDLSKSILEQQIDGKDANEWMLEEAANSIKRIFLINDKMNELGLTMTDEELEAASKAGDNDWSSYSSLFSSHGISRASFDLLYGEIPAKNRKIFKALYGKGGSKEVTEADMKKYIEENYTDFSMIGASTYKTNSDSSTSSGTPDTTNLTDEEKKELQQTLQGYVDKVKDGSMTMQEAADAYKEYAELDTEQLISNTVNLETAGFPDELNEELGDMEAGEVRFVDLSDSVGLYLVLRKGDIAEKSAEYLEDEDRYFEILSNIKGEEYDNAMKEEVAAYTGVTFNQAVIDKYQPSIFNDAFQPVSSTAASSSAGSTASSSGDASSQASSAASSAPEESSASSGE